MRVFALAALVAAALLSGQASAQGKAQGIAAQVCAACHASDGNSIGAANPKIAGQFPEYLDKQLRDFKPQGGKKAARENAIMAGMVANLSDADIKGLATYYASQKLKPAAAADKDLAALGQKVWRGGNAASGVPACAGCHGPAGAARNTLGALASTRSTSPPSSRHSRRAAVRTTPTERCAASPLA